MQTLVPAQKPVPDFTPVPRKYRYDGWTPDRQRAFIAALAETGSVKAAAKRINMSSEGAYFLRRQPGADSFRAAWEAALDHGVQRLLDTAIDRALEGVPVPVFYQGEQCGERRAYNDRLLMFILRHHLSGKEGGPGLSLGKRSRESIEREAAALCPACREGGEAEAATDAALRDPEAPLTPGIVETLDRIFEQYLAKVRNERQLRCEGDIVGADYAVRQLTHIELILTAGGMTEKLIQFWTNCPAGEWGGEKYFACEVSKTLDDLRRKAWAAEGEPVRPPLPHYEIDPGVHVYPGPNWEERNRARLDAERRMALAQTEWEAAQREDTWEEWKKR